MAFFPNLPSSIFSLALVLVGWLCRELLAYKKALYPLESHSFRLWCWVLFVLIYESCFLLDRCEMATMFKLQTENGTSHLLLHAHKWFLFATTGIFSDKSLRSFRHMLSCTTVILYYPVEMYVYLSDDCQTWHYFWISLTCQLGHSSQLMIFAAVGWDAWLLMRVRFRCFNFRGGNSKLSLRIKSSLNSKALLRHYNLQVFSSSCHQDLFCHMQSCLQGVGS